MPAELIPGGAQDQVGRYVCGGLVARRQRTRLVVELEPATAARAPADHAEAVRGRLPKPLEAAVRAGHLCLFRANHTTTIGRDPDAPDRTDVQFSAFGSNSAA